MEHKFIPPGIRNSLRRRLWLATVLITMAVGGPSGNAERRNERETTGKPGRASWSTTAQQIKTAEQVYKNIQVFKGLPASELEPTMAFISGSLGVKCNFCHVRQLIGSDSLNYASDAEPMKENAREMMKMTIQINKNNFYFDKNERPEFLHTVTCKTCHRGEPFPPEN